MLSRCRPSKNQKKLHFSITLHKLHNLECRWTTGWFAACTNASDIAGRYLGKNWSRRFKKRNPQVITAKPAKLDLKQAKNFNKTIVNDYFDKWEELNEQYGGIPPDHIWNMDEQGIQMGGGRKNSGKGYFYHQISSDNLELVTVTFVCDLLTQG